MFNRTGNLRRFAFVKLVNRTSRVGRGGNHIKPGIVQLILPSVRSSVASVSKRCIVSNVKSIATTPYQ